MKLHILFISFILFPYLFLCDDISICCCMYNKDAFRGFQGTSSKVHTLSVTGKDKADISYMLVNICYGLKGFPTFENIQRIKTGESKVTQAECARECSFLIRQLNDKYNISQEKNRLEEAKKLKLRKVELLKKLHTKILENVNCFYSGKKCSVSIKTKPRQSVFQAQALNILMKNSKKGQSLKRIGTINSSMISFDSVTLSDHQDLINPELEMQLRTDEDSHTNRFLNIQLDTSNSKGNNQPGNENEKNIQKEIEALDLQIMYLEQKNKKPIAFILDRFTIKDTILVMMIHIFEKTLDDAVNNMKSYFEDMINTQFKMTEKLLNSMKKI